ncbi:hypothetical protein NQ317_010836 [Molorchus minor]|uniref:Uncharacterized protein n=1 Tax=Molorchus minor TaxID=1323400 RepID=A0ABQ9JKW6_9CUCU|nr:hypothetical protein NQ317_010836 [Molorchus minor]
MKEITSYQAPKMYHHGVLEGNAEQIAMKRQMAEQQLKMKEAENEMLRLIFDQNERLQAESDRLEREVMRQYRDDLMKQIEYNNKLRVSTISLWDSQMYHSNTHLARFGKEVSCGLFY